MARDISKLDNIFNSLKNHLKGNVAKDIKEIMMKETQEAFNKQSWGGSKWKLLTPSSLKDKKKKGFGSKKIMERTGKLKNGIRWKVKKSKVIISFADYGYKHLVGTNRLPKRQFVGKSHETADKIRKVIEKSLRKIYTAG